MFRYVVLLVVVVLMLLVNSGYGYIVKDGNCSLVSSSMPVVTNFELEKYLGKWYEIERYEQDYQRNLECVTAEYIRNSQDASVDVKSKGFLATKDAYASFAGIAVMSDPQANPTVGKLNVSYGIRASGISNYWIVDTDYVNYAVVYSCTPIADSESIIEGYWLLSRTPALAEEPQLMDKLQYLQTNYFVPSHVRATNQSESLCRKEPEIPPVPAETVLPPLP
ncbi:apolipoprotein D-like [Ochlerotatus camptorhynchus]|uniref:apolipoprotein D-like n=1 Tax=Ochlerotatus camptorhynchus TaxID=644619 RepID=UPI0031DD887E